MKFSIIIPTYNSAGYITGCLDHIESLNYDKDMIEVIIVDGGSKDNTSEIAISYGAKVVSCKNTSVSNSRNVGADFAQHETLVFIESDCLVHTDLLSKSKSHLKHYS